MANHNNARRSARAAFARLAATGFALAAGLLILAAATASAAPKNGTAKSGGDAAVPEVPGDDIFGFIHSADLGNAGDFGFSQEWDGRLGKRDGSYRAYTSKSEFGYTFTDNFAVNLSAFGAWHRIRNVTDFADVSGGAFDGLSMEFHHRILKRSAGNPFAVTLAVEPRWARVDSGSGLRSEGRSAEFKIFTDAVVVPGRIFWAANFVWGPQRSQDPEDRAIWLTTSSGLVSTALTLQISEKLFVGAEARHLSAYNAAWFDERVGYAIYVGPTLLWKLTDKIAFNATWQPQVSGRSIDNPSLRYDLDNFERAHFRAKLTVAFN